MRPNISYIITEIENSEYQKQKLTTEISTVIWSSCDFFVNHLCLYPAMVI